MKKGSIDKICIELQVLIIFCLNKMRGVVPWLVNVAVSEMTLMRMRVCGQLANIINPIHTKYSRYERTLHRR